VSRQKYCPAAATCRREYEVLCLKCESTRRVAQAKPGARTAGPRVSNASLFLPDKAVRAPPSIDAFLVLRHCTRRRWPSFPAIA
jgi:hypothetical protein